METVDKQLDKIVHDANMKDIKEKIGSFINKLFGKKPEIPNEKTSK
jgi:hypothetical protein